MSEKIIVNTNSTVGMNYKPGYDKPDKTTTELQIMLYEKCKKEDKEYESKNPPHPDIIDRCHPNSVYWFFQGLRNTKLTDDAIEYIMSDLEANNVHSQGLYYIYTTQKLNQKAIKKAIEIGDSLSTLVQQTSSSNQ